MENSDGASRNSTLQPLGTTPNSSRREMSASLRDRLRRSSRYFKSPVMHQAPFENNALPETAGSNQHVIDQRALDSSPLNQMESKRNKLHQTLLGVQHHSFESRTVYGHGSCLLFDESEDVEQEKITCESPAKKKLKRIEASEEILLSDAKFKRARSLNANDVSDSKGELNEDQENIYSASLSLAACQESSSVADTVELASVSNTGSMVLSSEQLNREKCRLLAIVRQKEETLRKLKLVQMYRMKNDLDQLQQITLKWRQLSQTAFQDLWQMISEPRPTLTEFMQHMQIDINRVGYNPEDESFS